MKRKSIMIGIIQLLIFISMFVKSKELLLLDYINISFIYGGIVVFIGLCIYVLSSGFFDIFTVSMRKVFARKSHYEEAKNMRPPSELITISSSSFLQVGGITLLLMLLALTLHYK